MASVTSQGPSPHSPFDFDSNGDTDESWQYLDYSSGASNPASVGFLPSPASGSLSGFAIVGHVNAPSPSAISPLPGGELDQTSFFPTNTSHPAEAVSTLSDPFATTATSTDGGFGQDMSMAPQQYLFSQADLGDFSRQQWNDFGSLMNTFQTDVVSPLNFASPGSQEVTLELLNAVQSGPNLPPWTPGSTGGLTDNIVFEDPRLSLSPSSGSSHSSLHFTSPLIKAEPSTSRSPPTGQLHKVKNGKIEKKKPEQAGNFVIVTPNSITAHAGRPNPFECFEAARTTQRGRKGPLADATKENALQVRRLGACFCCHSRKVKCDKKRPCRNCERLMHHVPQVVCWQFQDFLPVLFPDFIRAHFKKEEMAKFVQDNVGGFTVGGVEKPCEVELYSGSRFSTTLTVKAKFFTPKTCDILNHWHLNVGRDQVDLQSNGSAPIGVELDSPGLRDGLRKKTKAYVQGIIQEPAYAEQVTESIRSTMLPQKVLRIVQTYAQQSDCTMVKRALSIYAMQYILTRHLCLTSGSLFTLQSANQFSQNSPYVTPRLLARQIKCLVDELMLREMQQLFELFSKSLKPRARSEWAKCLAAFLVLCLFMESVETATDSYVVAHNEISLRNNNPREYERSFALNACKEVENLPFKQFAYQFHNIYQTHSKDASTKSFNPLFDDSFAEQGELDGPAMQLVESLKELYYGEDWRELDFLATDDMILGRADHPFPMNPEILYTGRLLAKFLMSFTNEDAIFESKI